MAKRKTMNQEQIIARAAVRAGDKLVGFDPMMILPIITFIIETFRKCKEPKDPVQAKAMVSEEMASDDYQNRKVPLMIRRKLKRKGVANEHMFAYYSSCIEELNSQSAAVLAGCF